MQRGLGVGQKYASKVGKLDCGLLVLCGFWVTNTLWLSGNNIIWFDSFNLMAYTAKEYTEVFQFILGIWLLLLYNFVTYVNLHDIIKFLRELYFCIYSLFFLHTDEVLFFIWKSLVTPVESILEFVLRRLTTNELSTVSNDWDILWCGFAC